MVFDSHPRDVAILILDILKTNRAGGLKCYQHFLRMPEHIKKKVRPSIFVQFYVHVCVISEGDNSTTI